MGGRSGQHAAVRQLATRLDTQAGQLHGGHRCVVELDTDGQQVGPHLVGHPIAQRRNEHLGRRNRVHNQRWDGIGKHLDRRDMVNVAWVAEGDQHAGIYDDRSLHSSRSASR